MSFRGGKASLFFYSMIYVHVSNIPPYNYRWTSDALSSIIQQQHWLIYVKALRCHLQSIALSLAKHCVVTCNSIALSIAIVLPEVVQFLKMYMPSIYIYSSEIRYCSAAFTRTSSKRRVLSSTMLCFLLSDNKLRIASFTGDIKSSEHKSLLDDMHMSHMPHSHASSSPKYLSICWLLQIQSFLR